MRAIVRHIPSSFARALSGSAPAQPVDVARARAQHAVYVAALDRAGVSVRVLDALDDSPDSVFVEDTAVVVDDVIVVTRPGAPSRRGEVDSIAAALASPELRSNGGAGRPRELVRMTEPATLDGGDCMRVGATLYVGRSARTNAEGVAFLRSALPIRVVDVALPPGVLHLKCVCSPLGGERLLLAEGSIDPSVFAGCDVIVVPHRETYAANAVAVGRSVLVAAGHPRTSELLARAGFDLLEVPTSEARKADGSLTCQSILLDLDRPANLTASA